MNKVKELYYKFKILAWFNQNKKPLDIPSGRPRCFVFLAADYGNLGDVAITYAQEKFLGERLPDYAIVDVPISKTLSALYQVKRTIGKDDIVTIVGGGNMSDMYFDIELLRLMVVDLLKKNRIVVFPQTVCYSDSPEAEYLTRLGKRIYCSHPFLTICAREEVSYKLLKQIYQGIKVILAPDIVMSLDLREPKKKRNIVTFCLRDDKEKADNGILIQQIRHYCAESKIPVQYRDTHIGRGDLSLDERAAELENIWGDFRRSMFVVTDRLHGMIFAYITGTPAIVLPNNNFKIERSHKWIANCENIYFVKDELINLQSICKAPSNHILFEQNNKQFSQKIEKVLFL